MVGLRIPQWRSSRDLPIPSHFRSDPGIPVVSAEALVGAAVRGLSGWTLGHIAGAGVVAVRRGVRWASVSLVGRSRPAGGNGATVGASTAGVGLEAACVCSKRMDDPENAVLEAVPTDFHTASKSSRVS